MIGKLPNLNPEHRQVEYDARELHNLTDIPLASCMRIVCELDDLQVSRALTFIVQTGITSTQAQQLYLALCEVEMLTPTKSKPRNTTP
jgi:hypothetical protein